MFERHVRTIDRKMQTLIAADEARARKLEILTSIPGIAATTAAGLLRDARAGALSGNQSGRVGRRSARVGGLAGPGQGAAPVHAGGDARA